MATLHTAIASRNAELDALARQLDNGYLKGYTGALVSTPETAATGVLLTTLRFNAVSAAAASGGVLTYNPFTSDSDAAATGTVGYVRAFKSDGITVVFDGDASTVAAGTGVAQFANTSIVQHTIVSVSAGTYTLPQ